VELRDQPAEPRLGEAAAELPRRAVVTLSSNELIEMGVPRHIVDTKYKEDYDQEVFDDEELYSSSNLDSDEMISDDED